MRESKPPPMKEAGYEVRPMSFTAATAWSSGIILTFWLLMVAFAPANPDAQTESDIIGNSACQAITYLLGLFLILRIHAPEASIRDFLGVRSTHVAFYPLALALGVAVQIPVQTLYTVIARRWPSAPEAEDRLIKMFAEAPTAKRVAIGAIIVLLGPLIEEIFFRGALFRPLRKRYTGPQVIAVTTLFFAVSHGLPQMFIPIAIVGAAMGILRSASGSLVPSLLLHATFNAIPFYALANAKPGAPDASADAMPPLWLTITATAASVAIVLLVHFIGSRASTAARAQERDLR